MSHSQRAQQAARHEQDDPPQPPAKTCNFLNIPARILQLFKATRLGKMDKTVRASEWLATYRGWTMKLKHLVLQHNNLLEW